MNKFRKFLIGITVAAAAGCLCGAVACNQGGDDNGSSGVIDEKPPVYYQLDLKGSGIDVVFDGDLAELDEKGEGFKFGGSVKEGVEVRFKVLVGTHATGTPVVSLAQGNLGGEVMTPGADGFYAFTMEANSTISVTGLQALYTLSFPKSEEVTSSDGQVYRQERRIKFFDENDEEIDEEISLTAGSDFRFRLWVSPYYKDEYTVSCGFDVLTEEDGFYTIKELSEDGEINVSDLTMEESFANFEDGRYGDGSAEHPYELSKPVDMFYLAAMINDDFYAGRYSALHYKLTADIDMEGEQLYVIGDNSTNVSAFSGTFDGCGHTVSNFYITDEVYDQSTYALEYLPYVGLFGYAVATVNSSNVINPPVIKNLTLKDYSVQVHPASAGAGTYVGSLLGWGIGAEVTNCNAISGTGTVNGKVKGMMIINDNNQIINAGGLVGRLQGAYGDTARGAVSHAAFVRAGSADVFMEGNGSPHSAGGIVGYLISADESAIAYVVNSYTRGSINGAMRAGGIVGTLGRFSTVSNSYSTAQIHANNSLEGLITEEFRGAYAGGIAGFAEENTVIAGCYSANYTSASVNSLSAYSTFGAKYMRTGAFAGSYTQLDPATSALAADYAELIEYKNQTAVASPAAGTFTALGWSADDWTFADGSLPEVKANAPGRNITVKIKNGSSEVLTKSVTGYMPLSDWYKQTDGLKEYDINAGRRSWGYFFDAEMTKRAPYGFVPVMTETELYAGYADYAQAAGTYYVAETAYSNGAHIKLNADGTAEIRSGGLYYECTYTYDGENVIIYRSCLASLSYTESQVNGNYFAYGGKLQNGALSLSAYVTLASVSGSSQQVSYVNEVVTLTAVKANENFVYGEYKDENGNFYTFRNNGTGVMTGRTSSSAFTFVPAGGEFEITFEPTGFETVGRKVTVKLNAGNAVDTINDVSVSAIDGFKGSWKKSANSAFEFEFDGEGYVSLNGGEKIKLENAGDAVGFEIGNVEYKATLSNGSLVINGETYYLSDGFTGEWFMIGAKEQIQLSLDGIGTDGYGSALISYTGGESVTYEAEYDVLGAQDGRHLRIYVGDRAYGDLVLNSETNTASGSFYSELYGEYRAVNFNIYDVFRGVWTGDSDNFDSVTFNGKSAAAGSSEVSVRTAAGVPSRGTYTLESTSKGRMTVDGKTYNIIYSETENMVTFTEVADEQPVNGQLGRRDGWYGVVLYDGETTYTFDGKSKVGGHVAVSGGDPLEYTVDGNGAVTMGGETLTATAQGFDWKDGIKLTFKTGFADSWFVSGSDTVLAVNEVSGFFTADVSGETFVYDPVAKTLTLTEGENTTVLTLMGDYELSIARTVDGENEDYNCIRSARADSWRGEYPAADGSKWKFDGLGSCIYGSGTATYTSVSGDPVRYSYRVNALGNPYITGEDNVTFIEAADGKFESGGKSYKTVEVDLYYGRTVAIVGDPKSYFFDGISTVWVKSREDAIYTEKAYTYEIVTSVLCELIDKDGLRHNGRMASIGLNIRLTVTDQVTATAGGVTYAFGISTLWQKGAGNSYTKAYDFAATNADNVYDLTDANGDIFTGTLKSGESGNTLTIEPKAVVTATLGTGDGAKTYVFGDGAGTVWLMGENGSYTKAYSYKVIDETEREYELRDGDGKIYIAKLTLDKEGNYTMDIVERITAAAGEVTYSFGVDTVRVLNEDGSYGKKAYDFTAGAAENEYELKDGDGKKFTAKLTLGDDGTTYSVEITPVEAA